MSEAEQTPVGSQSYSALTKPNTQPCSACMLVHAHDPWALQVHAVCGLPMLLLYRERIIHITHVLANVYEETANPDEHITPQHRTRAREFLHAVEANEVDRQAGRPHPHHVIPYACATARPLNSVLQARHSSRTPLVLQSTDEQMPFQGS